MMCQKIVQPCLSGKLSARLRQPELANWTVQTRTYSLKRQYGKSGSKTAVTRMNDFNTIFGIPPEAEGTAPGRVNLLGEHTDYNDGFVLPTIIPRSTHVQVSPGKDEYHHAYSADTDRLISWKPQGDTPSGFAAYLHGCVKLLEAHIGHIPPLYFHITSTVPIGSGLSSSAALEIATLRSICSLLRISLDDVALAKLGQEAEKEYAGVACGIMDQMAVSLGKTDAMLFLDTRSLEVKLLPLPSPCEVLVMDSGIPRNLAASGYNARRRQCEEAARLLELASLRDLQALDDIDELPSPMKQRARHVFTENARVLEGVKVNTADHFGRLMNASHASLRDDFQVSIEALDTLVELLQETPRVFGARLTGAGFGGACVALVERGYGREVGRRVLEAYQSRGYSGAVLVP